MVKLIVTVQSHGDGHQPKMKKDVEECFKELRACLIHMFKHIFSNFKQHYMYFYTLFHLYLFFKKKLKTVI